MVAARNISIYVNSIGDIVLTKGVIVDCGIPLPSRALHCLQERLLVCRLEKLSSDYVGFH